MEVSASGFRFRSPPLKMLAGMLKGCSCRASAEGAAGPPSFWLDRVGRGAVEVTVVWMQGTVLEVRPERGTTVRLQDDTGLYTVSGLDTVPQGTPCVIPGKYVMVMGIVQSCSPEPVLRAVKMTDLTCNPLHKRMWELEVKDLHNYVP
ncbi:recQ-mediated genome instability protein 2 [Microcaecilia unicolor]|uniref:RecQ-mediated genome instability protein 2 n=1 Tax=Microcaecilia unicolor TaxID=1415580 RepID=A0A6P7YS39_9AMPH|nr:recQ-mediated genome instability protein 2 [Microcaecilia unicolor]